MQYGLKCNMESKNRPGISACRMHSALSSASRHIMWRFSIKIGQESLHQCTPTGISARSSAKSPHGVAFFY
jgi:hypothetical protein